jgi:hypothetical protein
VRFSPVPLEIYYLRSGGEKLIAVAVRVAHVHTATTAQIVNLTVLPDPTTRTEVGGRALESRQHVVEGGIIHEKGVVTELELLAIVELECQIVVDSHWRERPDGLTDVEAQEVGEKPRRALLVARG